jgi:agmatine deiminase
VGKQKTPAALGYRMPAEWEPHEATWIGWPHNVTDWPGRFGPIPWVYGEIARKIAAGESVRILVESSEHEARARRVLRKIGASLAGVEFFRHVTDRGWTRDFGPMFVKKELARGDKRGAIAVVKFRFNAWAKYPEWRKDNHAAERAARALDCPVFRAESGGAEVVLEGGGMEVNGRGTLLTTEECLLDSKTQVRNPGLGKQGIEKVMRDFLGVRNILWLGRGIDGDDTHGHVDDLCRFVNPRTAVLCQEEDSGDANYRPLQENRERLQGMRLEDGSKIEMVPLPMPAPVWFAGQRLPASYANFYISNAAVLVPTFNDPKDRMALGILSELFSDRPVIGIHSLDLVWGLGTLHCLTQQQPAVE